MSLDYKKVVKEITEHCIKNPVDLHYCIERDGQLVYKLASSGEYLKLSYLNVKEFPKVDSLEGGYAFLKNIPESEFWVTMTRYIQEAIRVVKFGVTKNNYLTFVTTDSVSEPHFSCYLTSAPL